jgi:hypothetical protein
MTAEQPGYLAYLLRLWQVNDDGKPVWRASLESPHTGERHSFANLEMLFAFLVEKTGGFAPRAQPQAKPESSKKGGGE